MASDHPVLVPAPSTCSWEDGAYRLDRDETVCIPAPDRADLAPVADLFVDELATETAIEPEWIVDSVEGVDAGITVRSKDDLGPEAYELTGGADGITIAYGGPAGAFYGTRTLKQIVVQRGRSIPHHRIVDDPDFEDLGVMLDVSRDKIPTLETLRGVVDLLADLKINQFQLYVQGFSFAYPSFPETHHAQTPLTGADMWALDRYCRERFVEFVPNQNSLGHMEEWLDRPAFRPLAECPDGFENDRLPHSGPQRWPPTTMCPEDPAVPEFLEQMFDDFLPYFESDVVNVGLDEPWELGKGRSADAVAERGLGEVYLDHVRTVRDIVTERGFDVQFWGDIASEHPELLPEVPENATLLEWGYFPDHPFAEHAQTYAEHDQPFYVCPGTNSWRAITGRTEIMRENLLEAATVGQEYGAEGYLLTDWGDQGHWQPLPVSYPAYAYGAGLAWGPEENRDADVSRFLDEIVFRDRAGVLGDLLQEAGNYYQLEDAEPNPGNVAFKLLQSGLAEESPQRVGPMPEALTVEAFDRLEERMDRHLEELAASDPRCADADLVVRELEMAFRLVRHAARFGRLRLRHAEDGAAVEFTRSDAQDLEAILEEFRAVWLARNRYSRLETSIAPLRSLLDTYEDLDLSAE
jgi:hypothetical protein